MYRYVKIDKNTNIITSKVESDNVFTMPDEDQDTVWYELDASYDDYTIDEIIVNEDHTISPDTDAKNAREAAALHEQRWQQFPSIREQLYALYKSRKGDNTRLDAVDSTMDAVVAELGED